MPKIYFHFYITIIYCCCCYLVKKHTRRDILGDLGTDGNILLRTLKACLQKRFVHFWALASNLMNFLIQQTRILYWPNDWYKLIKMGLQTLQSEIPEKNYQLKNEEITLFCSYLQLFKTNVGSVITCKTKSLYPAIFSSPRTVKYTELSPEQIRQLLQPSTRSDGKARRSGSQTIPYLVCK
jgi:hypothetical protein